MEVQALTKYTRMSPKKVREVAREIQGRRAADALDLLKFIPRKSARLIAKTLTSAVANAENNHNLSSDSLIVKRALIEEGPAFKRFNPVARGSAHPIRKRTSHIRIVLTDEVAEPKKKAEPKQEKAVAKKAVKKAAKKKVAKKAAKKKVAKKETSEE